ncbi:MAG: hypothetical protein QM642_09405 [Edaphocola sp.]
MTDTRLTREQYDELTRVEQSLDGLYEWLERCTNEDADLIGVLKPKIATLVQKLDKLLNN